MQAAAAAAAAEAAEAARVLAAQIAAGRGRVEQRASDYKAKIERQRAAEAAKAEEAAAREERLARLRAQVR